MRIVPVRSFAGRTAPMPLVSVAAPFVLKTDANFMLRLRRNQAGLFSPSGQVKPAGVPIGLDWTDDITNGLMWYAIDGGDGQFHILADCPSDAGSPGHLMYPPNIKGGFVTPPSTLVGSQGACQWGRGCLWPGAVAENADFNGMQSYVYDGDRIRTAQNLSNQGAGAGFTIGSSYVQTTASAPFGGLIFGRPARALEAAPFAQNLLMIPDAGSQVQFWWDNNGTGTNIISPASFAMNAFHTAFGVTRNDSAGSATCTLIVDGGVQTSASGQVVIDALGNENNEGQIMLGSCYHIASPKVQEVFGGFTFWGGIWSRALSRAETARIHAAPYSFVLWPDTYGRYL